MSLDVLLFCLILIPIVVPLCSAFSFLRKLSEYKHAKREGEDGIRKKRWSLIWTGIVLFVSILFLVIGLFSVLVFDGTLSFM